MSLNLVVQPTENIQTYIDMSDEGGGGVVSLIGATYNLTEDINIPSNVTLQGVGSGGTVIDFGNLAKQIKITGTAMNPVDSASLRGICVQNSSVELIKASYTNNLKGNDVLCIGGDVGVSISDSTILNWEVNTIDSCGTGIMMSNVSGFTINNAFVTNIDDVGAYVCDNVTNGVLVNSSLDTVTGSGFSFTDSGNVGLDQISIINVDGNGILLDSISGSFSVTNGLVSGSTGNGMNIQNSSSQIQVMTMQFSDNTGYGVSIDDAGSTNNLFVGNTFANNTAGAFDDSGTGTLIRSNIGLSDN